MSETPAPGATVALQIVDTKTLRKLLSRIESLKPLNALMEDIVNQPFVVTNDTQSSLLQRIEGVLGVRKLPDYDDMLVKKVKENAHMTAFLREIKVYLETGNFDSARKAIVRLVESKAQPQPQKPKQPVDSGASA